MGRGGVDGAELHVDYAIYLMQLGAKAQLAMGVGAHECGKGVKFTGPDFLAVLKKECERGREGK